MCLLECALQFAGAIEPFTCLYVPSLPFPFNSFPFDCMVCMLADRPSMAVPGASDVGPGEYNPPPAACDPQVDSRKSTCATIKFGEGYKAGSNSNKFDFSEPTPGYVAFCLYVPVVQCRVVHLFLPSECLSPFSSPLICIALYYEAYTNLPHQTFFAPLFLHLSAIGRVLTCCRAV
jgi:hypothetical protein